MCPNGQLDICNHHNGRKYKDANLLGDVDDSVEEGTQDTSTSTTSVTIETEPAFPQDSVEEIDTGEIRR